MILRYWQMINLPVVSISEGELAGHVGEVAFFSSELKIAAFLLKAPFLQSHLERQIITASDIREVDKEAVAISDFQAISTLRDSIRVQRIIHDKAFGLNQWVFTKTGVFLGRVKDFYFDSQTLAITKFVVKGFLAEHLIDRKNIIDIKRHKITVKTELIEVSNRKLSILHQFDSK